MDGQKFDAISRALAGDTSRRGLLRGLAGTAMGSALALFGVSRGTAAPAGKVGICHKTGSATNPLVYIEVSANALPAHTAHGDLVSCPGAGFIDPATCTCDCPLTDDECPNLEVVDEAACACFCDTANTTCDTNYALDSATCTCVCSLTDDQCPNLELADQDSCSCYCPADTIVCQDGYSLDAASCSCVCALTDDQCPNLEVADEASCSCYCPVESIVCDAGFTFNPDTCTCDQNPDPQCAGATCSTFTTCSNDNADCVCGSLVGGGGICIPGSTPCDSLESCSAELTCPDGRLCSIDSCCGRPVCVSVDLQCSGVVTSGRRAELPAGDGPTFGHP